MRTSLFTPTAELHCASDLIVLSGELLVKGDPEGAAEAMFAADMPELFEHFTWATSRVGHGGPAEPQRPRLPRDRQSARTRPPVAVLRGLHARDGYRCRYCSIRIIDGDVFRKLRRLLPGAVRWGRANIDQHAALLCLRASHDHVIPRSLGGENAMANYVTACWLCQFGRGSAALEDLEIGDPRLRPPIVDEWDGLRRILVLRG